jgi:tetratricopeptide (TPR) repeat protein
VWPGWIGFWLSAFLTLPLPARGQDDLAADRATMAIAEGEAALQEGRTADAIDELRRAQALLGLEQIYSGGGESRPPAAFEAASARIHRGLAEAYLKEGRAYAAAVEADYGVNADHEDARLWTLLGLARYRLAEVDSAAAALGRAAALGADDADLHWGRALVAVARNQVAMGIEEVRRARERRADSRFALALARWAELQGDHGGAAAALEDFLRLAPGDPQAEGTRNLARFHREVSRAPAGVVDPGVTRVQIRFDLKPGDEIPYVPARLDGQPEAYVLFDTGAERNLLDRAYAESIGIAPILPGGAVHGAWRSSPAGHAIVDSLELGTATVRRVPFAVTDFANLQLRLQGEYYIAAIVNPALLFRDFLVVLDYHTRRIELERMGPASEPYGVRRTRLRKATTPFHFAANGVWPVLPASIDGSRVLPFLVDTGASDVLIDRETAAALRIDPLHLVIGAAGHSKESLRAILLDGELSEPWEMELRGLLGYPFFRGMRVAFDYRNMTLTLEN